MKAVMLMDGIEVALVGYVFRCRSEADLQAAVAARLREAHPELRILTEVRTRGGRFDVTVVSEDARLVLELKLRASVAAVERQAQRYALRPWVDGVVVVTTSQRLAAQLREAPAALGGKPFRAIAVRTT